MYKYILETAGNINWMAVFSLLTFFIIFSISIYLVVVKKESDLKHMAELPLADDNQNTKS
ncbi:MAG: hypothetical protein V3V14_00890 [Saprospiraceae bacterium]